MKLKFMLQGGYMPPYVVYQPVLTNTGRARVRGGSSGIFDSISSSSSKSSSKDSDNKDDVTAKDILLMLDKTKALPIDRNAISARVLSLIGISSISGAVDPSLMAMEYLRTMNDLKNASFAYDEYASTWRQAQSKDALNEVALSPDNKLYVKTEDGNISPISIELYQLHKDELGEPLTNSLLMHYRAYMSSNPAILDSVANAISLDTVNSLIHNYIGTIGYDESSKTTMLKKKDLTILNGVEALQKAADDGDYNSDAGLDGIYALVETNHNNVEDIDKMLNYVYDMLPKRAKALLDYHGNGEKGAKEIIAQFVTAGTIKKTNFSDTLKFDVNGKKVGSKSSSTGSSTEEFSDLFTNISTGQGGNYSKFSLKDPNGNIYSISGLNYPNLSYDPSHRIQSNGSLQFLMDYGYNSVTKGGDYAITFEDQVLDSNDFKDIVFMNDRQATRVILPTTIDTNTGKIIPDLNFMSKNLDLIDLINSKGLNDTEVQKKLIELDLIDPYSGLPDTTKFLPYLCINGLGTNKIITTDLAELVKSSEQDVYKDIFVNAVYNKDSVEGKDYKYDYDDFSLFNPFDWGFLGGSSERMYKGTIFIPITLNLAQTKIGAGTNVKVSTQDQLQELYNIGDFRNRTNFTLGSSQLLNN